MADTLARRFARFATSLRYEDLPPQVIDKAKACILHCLGVGLAAHGSSAVQAARAAILAEEARPEAGATILVTGEQATCYGAAFVNSALMHAKLQEDAYHTGSHPGVMIVPAALAIAGIGDVKTRRARLAVRPQGSGAQLLLLSLLHRASLSLADLVPVAPPSPTGPDIAQAIRAGRADCGVATRAVAQAAGLDFVPIVWERFDIAMRQRDYFHPPLQAVLNFLRGDAFAARARELGGYDISAAGAVRHAP